MNIITDFFYCEGSPLNTLHLIALWTLERDFFLTNNDWDNLISALPGEFCVNCIQFGWIPCLGGDGLGWCDRHGNGNEERDHETEKELRKRNPLVKQCVGEFKKWLDVFCDTPSFSISRPFTQNMKQARAELRYAVFCERGWRDIAIYFEDSSDDEKEGEREGEKREKEGEREGEKGEKEGEREGEEMEEIDEEV